MKVKRPFIIDIWEGNKVVDWDFADGYVICASWSPMREDGGFGASWTMAARHGKPRSAYYSIYPQFPIADQAALFVKILQKYGYNNEPIWVDAEVQGFTLRQVIDFAYNVERNLGKRPGCYSWAWKIDGMAANASASDKSYIKGMWFWGAGWPNNPDLFDGPPSSYISKFFGETVLWQYAGDINPADLGIRAYASNIDLNWVDPDFYQAWGKAAPEPEPTVDIYIVQRPWSEVEVCLTPSTTDVLPLRTPLEQAQAYGWEAAMNCGAGFDYTDATHARVKGTSVSDGIKYSDDSDFQSFACNDYNTLIPYARKMMTGGVINPDLDTTYRAPWSMMGFGGGNVYLIVTSGQEALSGMTQAQAAEWAAAQGILDLYLFDSGHSSGIVEGGNVLYSAYGEAVPQCIGLRPKTSGGSMKGVCKVGMVANIKNISTGVLLHQMTAGEYVYGDLSTALTDLVNFSHYYTAAGVKIELGAVCKVSKTNLVVTNESEPVTPPPPPPVTDDSYTVDVVLTDKDAAGNVVATYKASGVVLVKQ